MHGKLSTKFMNKESERKKRTQELSDAQAKLSQNKSNNNACSDQFKCCLVKKKKVACELI